MSSVLMATLLVVAGNERGPVSEVRARTAAAGSTYLCSGYSGCRAAGYSDAGYGARSSTMYWRMYPGHNCTNYAAYRMVKAGMPNERPWSGGGNASEWGLEMSEITDRRPAVGAIAWWARYSGGVGSSGHVAYVEQVISNDEIVISEDSWGGTFHWRRITRDSGRWPTGFIHFVDKSLSNTTVPTITGTPQVGVPLRATTGRWKPAAEKFGYQWYAGDVRIAGATGQTFTPTAAERGKTLSVTVTARRADFEPATVTSAPTAKVAHGEFSVGAPPAIEGEPMVDESLTAVPAGWSPAPATTSYRWLANGVPIEGATGRRLTLTKSLVGKRIKVSTSAGSPGYRRAGARSAAVGPVVMGTIEIDEEYGVSGGTRVGDQLSVVPGLTRPADAAAAYQWLRDGVPVAGATGSTYDLTGADVGTVVQLRVTLTRRNYASREVVVGPASVVTTRPSLAVRAAGKPGRAVVRVRVTAPGVAPVVGKVTVLIAGRQRAGWLDAGRVRVVVPGVPAGRRTARVSYAGGGGVEAVRATETVHVTRPGSGRLQASID